MKTKHLSLYKTPQERVEYILETLSKGRTGAKMSKNEQVLLKLYNSGTRPVPVYELVYDLRNHRFGANIFNLRKMGFAIKTIHHGVNAKGQQEYSYILDTSSLPLVFTS